MITGTKILKHIDNIKARRPITAQIQMVNYCNNFCSYCRYVGVPSEQKKYVSFDEFKEYVRILDGLGVKGYILTGGEPTISRDFDKITAWLEEKGIPYGINTNFNILKKIKPVYLKVSLDGYDAVSYKETRKVDKYEKTVENIKQYIDWKKENNVPTLVGIQKLGLDVEGCRKFYEAHKGLDVNYISFRPVESVGHIYYNDNDERPVISFLEELRKNDKRVVINYKYYQVRECFKRCYANHLQIAVNPFGNVIYCCNKSDEIIGHISEPNILEKLANHKTNMADCHVPCRMTGANALVRDMEKETPDSMFI